MPNFFTDNADLVEAFRRIDLAEAVSVLEGGFSDPADGVPGDLAEAVDGYAAALELVGDIAGGFIAPRSQLIDREGAVLVDGRVKYAPATVEAYRRLAEAGFAGVVLPRRYGGLNFPATVYLMMIEIVARADASLVTMFGYQDVGEAIAHFGTPEVAARFLPDYCAGKTVGAMVLTEPGGGSDLQAIRTTARQDADGTWRLSGVKQFISNGNGGMLLVLARSELGEQGMFGLSLFACDGEGVTVSRLEEKMGIHGSPTCELVFDDAPAHLVGRRRMGLVQTMHILNHARLSVAAQALGIAEGAYRDAIAWARQRTAFGRAIVDIPQVAEMLVDMRTSLEAARALVYRAGEWLDLRNKLETEIDRVRSAGGDTGELKRRFKEAAGYVDLLSPAVKYLVTEIAQRVCLDAQQVHGGMGYMREMPIEQRVRDVRITTIYEGTSQVQAGSALNGVLADSIAPLLAPPGDVPEGMSDLADRIKLLHSVVRDLREAAATMTEWAREASARDFVDAYLGLYAATMLFDQARHDQRKRAVADRWTTSVLAAARGAAERIRLGTRQHSAAVGAICLES